MQLTNYIGIGNYATNVYSIRLGSCDTDITWVGYASVYGGTYTNASDRDYNRDIDDIRYVSDTIMQMRPRGFT